MIMLSSAIPIAVLVALAAAQDPSCSPGGNFDLSIWNLQLPTGPSSGGVDTIRASALQGCAGFSSAEYFFTDPSTSAMVLRAPGNPVLTGCATTSGSQHCRTELREVQSGSGSNAAWDPASGTNRLSVSMVVVEADDGTHGTAIGQVFASEASKPLAEMYYRRDGRIVVGVKPNAQDGQIIFEVGNVPIGTAFDYEMEYSHGVLSVTIDGNKTELDTFEWESPLCYFKAGNYNQAKTEANSEVHITAIEVLHSS